MPSFFTNGFASKRKEPRRGNSSSTPDKSKDTSTAKAGTSAGGSWVMFYDREGRPSWWNSSTGDWILSSTPVPQSFSNVYTPSQTLGVQQPVVPHGYAPYAVNPGFYGAAPQPWAIAPPLTPVIMPPVVPAPAPKKEKKSRGKYYEWEEFYDEMGRPIWIHSDTGKRTRKDPYV